MICDFSYFVLSFSAGEYGIAGSGEFAQHYAAKLGDRAVFYVNTGFASSSFISGIEIIHTTQLLVQILR